MAFREYINRNPAVAAAIAGAMVVVVGVVVAWQMSGGGPGAGDVAVPKRFFTADDGATYFADTIDKVPPFTTPDGKTAYRAHVVRCGTGGAPFVAYVQKYPDDQKKRLEGMFADPAMRGVAVDSISGPQDTPLIKKPKTGDTGWVDPKDVTRYEAIVFQNCPGGGTPQPVFPEE